MIIDSSVQFFTSFCFLLFTFGKGTLEIIVSF